MTGNVQILITRVCIAEMTVLDQLPYYLPRGAPLLQKNSSTLFLMPGKYLLKQVNAPDAGKKKPNILRLVNCGFHAV